MMKEIADGFLETACISSTFCVMAMVFTLCRGVECIVRSSREPLRFLAFERNAYPAKRKTCLTHRQTRAEQRGSVEELRHPNG